ncbi:uncharacterized protein LOC130759951 [Actinidia eriantha]|uniref:uncharacterized protein LOC130759951 n=1 Tax=Actinidia eriantha TaxID=165200 RepID=UPI00258AEA8F|nr:uncharacterized protein LOC130759951 [Actinidia eriantha]
MATVEWEEDEWDLVNDDGFVYKVKKRLCLDAASAISSLPPPDPAEEENCWQERKKGTLAKLKEKYQNEIDQWELLSITLWALQQRARKQQCRERTPATMTEIMSCDLDFGSPHPPRDSSGRRRVDDLILKAEADESLIQYVSNLCEMAGAVCSVHEKHMKRSLVDLPAWSSPRQLMASLCDD